MDRKAVKEKANTLADALDADVLFYNAELRYALADRVITECRGRRRRPTVFLILVTSGGDAHAAYRIARALQTNYKRVVVFIPGWCKSAGTLLAVGAHELVVSDFGELGPLDVQLRKPDEIGEVSSGLTVLDALDQLHDKANETFEEFMLSIKGGSSGAVTFKTAADIATDLTVGLFKEVYAQVNPMHIGEVRRLLNIAKECGERLRKGSRNITEKNLERLVHKYPDHRFVIDRGEAIELFSTVREPTDLEGQLSDCLGEAARYPAKDDAAVGFLSDEVALRQEGGVDSEAPTESRSDADTGSTGNGHPSEDEGRDLVTAVGGDATRN